MRSKKMMWLGSMALLGLLAPTIVRADVDPEAELKAMNERISAAIKDARAKQVQPDVAALQKERQEKAKEDVKDVDPTKVEPAKAMAWAQLFGIAQEPKKEIQALDRYLTSSPTPEMKLQAQTMLLGTYDELGDADSMVKVIKEMKPTDPKTAPRTVSITTQALDTVAEKKGVKTALDLLKQVEKQVPFDQLTPQASDALTFAIADERATLLDKSGKRADAIAALDTAKKHFAPDSQYLKRLTLKGNFITLVGSPAPPLKRDRGYGEFPGLAAYKGKVVVLDFMAHWCPPCKASLPEMKKMYEELHSKGLEVVSVTSFYGFFDQEQKLSADQEFAKMDGFVSKYGMTWPVVFSDNTNAENYGVSGIPQFVIIDQSGKVNSITVGYSPDLHAKMRKTIEDLLAKKVALK